MLALPWEDWEASRQFNQDASKRPHVDCSRIWDSKDDLRCTVEATLNVRVNALVGEATGTKVNDFDARLVGRFQQYVLRL